MVQMPPDIMPRQGNSEELPVQLPTECFLGQTLCRLFRKPLIELVGAAGFEPATPAV